MKNSKLISPCISFIGLVLILFSCQSKKVITDTKTGNNNYIGANVEVKNNERGVIFRRFSGGVDTSKIYLPGKYNISYFDRFITYNIDSQTENDIVSVISQDEKKIELSIKYSFRPNLKKVALLHHYIGENYPESVVKSEIHSTIEEYIKQILAINISTNEVKQHENQILSIARKKIAEEYVDLESLQIIEFNVQ